MRITILGAGALGSVVGGFMARAGHELRLIGRPAAMEAIARDGLHISGIWGEHHVQGIQTATEITASGEAPPDVLIICVKSYDTAQAIQDARPLIGLETLVCAYQNGLGNAEAIAEVAGWQRTVGVRAIYGAVCPKPGHVAVTVIAQPTALGPWRDDGPKSRIAELATAMDEAGLPTVYTDDIGPVLWAKVAYNCMLNPLSALLDVPYGVLATAAETRSIMEEVLEELYLVGQAKGIRLMPETAEAYRELFYDTLLPPTAAHYASMREDLRQGRRTEIDALNGAIERFGAALGIPTPANTYLTRMIRAREAFRGKG